MRLLALLLLAAVLVVGAVAVDARGVPAPLDDVVDEVRVAADGDNALRGTLTATTPEPTRLVVTLRSPGHELRITESAAATEHEVPLLGVRADTDYEVLLGTVEPARAGAAVGMLRTPELPPDLPPVEVTTADVERMSPGLTLFNQVYRPAPGADGFADRGFLTAVDETGAVVWYHREPLAVQDANRLEDGDLLVVSDETGARRLAPTGEVVGEWRGTSPGTPADEYGAGLGDDEVVSVPIDSMHHDVQETADGTLVTLRRLEQDVAYDEPLCPDDDDGDGLEEIVGDAVVVFDPDDGTVLEEHSLFDVLDPEDDPRKLEANYCIDYLDRHYPGGAPRDWTHANAVALSPDGDTWLVSNRHTDELVALRAVDEPEGPAGSLRWQLGPDGDFELTSGDWFWHQHAPEWQDDDTILLYDNGNTRDDAPEPYSRAVEYDIDEEAMTATQTWEHRMPEDLFASFLGDADQLDEDTVLITHGGQTSDCEGGDDSTIWGQVVEVDRASGDIVFDLTTRDLAGCVGWAIYRAERVPQLHPAGYDVEVVRR